MIMGLNSSRSTSPSKKVEYKYLLATGNNKKLLRNTFGRRKWWKTGEKFEDEDLNLYWVEFSRRAHFESFYANNEIIRSLNHFYNVTVSLTSKTGMFRSLNRYFMSIGKDPFSILPWTLVVTEKSRPTLINALKQKYLYFQYRCRTCGYKLSTNLIEEYESNNHQDLTLEENSNKDVDDNKNDNNNTINQNIPSTYLTMEEEIQNCSCSNPILYENIWIIKPTNGKQGRDIFLTKDMNELLDKTQPEFVVQKYIENPHLFHGRKYDIRVFGLLRSINNGNGLEGYIYPDCYLRTSSTKYELGHLDNIEIHLTNDAIQRKSPKFGQFETSNKITMPEYKQYFMDELGTKVGTDVYNHIRNQITEIMKISFKSIQNNINPLHHPNTFNLLGYDYLIDDQYNVILLEINTNPSINYDPIEVPFKDKLFPRMLEETFQLTIDYYFPPPEGEIVNNPGQVYWKYAPEFQPEIDQGKNRFQLIYTS